MNLGINKEEARLIYDSLKYFFRSTQVPDLVLDMYPGADLNDIMFQLKIIMDIGDTPLDEETKRIFIRSDK